MNCKPGDLAVIVSGKAFKAFIGRIVRVVATDGFLWSTEESLDGNQYAILLPDSCLRPLRDNDATDETLLWLPVPTKEHA